MKIKEFIGTDAMAAVEADGYTAGKMLAEFLQMSHKEASTNGFIEIAQKLTIEKVGRIYADKLAFITGAAILSNTRSIVLKIATASKHQRIAAMLSALSEIED